MGWKRLINLRGPAGTNEANSRFAALEAAQWYRGLLPSSVNGTLTIGAYHVPSSSWAQDNGLPFAAAGVLEEMPTGGFGRLQKWSTFGAGSRPNQEWKREKMGSAAWTEWTQSNAALPLKRALTPSDVLTTLEPGVYWITSLSVAQGVQATNPGFPSPAAGDLTVWPGAYKRMEWITTGLNSRPNEKWQTERRGDNTWTDWWRTDARAIVPSGDGSALGGSGSGFKVVPVTLTRDGNGGASKTVREARSERLRYLASASGTRIRFHIQNANLRSNEKIAGVLAMNGLWWGEHASGGAYASAPQQIHGAFNTPADGSGWVSPWLNIPTIRGTEYLASFGFTAASGQEVFYHIGQSYASDNPANASAQAHLGAGDARSVLDVWIEVETYATTPVVATIGSSTPTGVGADWPVQDSVVSLLADRLHALPMHYGGSGDTMANSSNFSWERWTRWAKLAKPDAVVMMQHTNDVFEAGMTLGILQARYLVLMQYLTENICANVYVTTVTPRTNVTGPEEDLRRQFNTWLKTLPGGARDCFDMAPAVSADDETLLPGFDSGDGYHLNTAGHAALESTVDRPLTTPPVMYAVI